MRGDEYCVYRYVEKETGKIIYIGKTDSSLKARVCAHRYEKPFQEANDFYIEYITLSNRVETDSIEKFLINKYKPILNTKDKIFGLTESISLEKLKWIPYENYLAKLKNPKQIKKAKIEANEKYEALLCLRSLYGETFFSFLPGHSFYLPLEEGYELTTETEVKKTLYGYEFKAKPEAISYIKKNFHFIAYKIWEPVLNLIEMDENEELQYALFLEELDFIDEIETFARDGYEDEKSLYKFDFHFHYPGDFVFEKYRNMFGGEVSVDKTNARGEIGKYECIEQINTIKQGLYSRILDFVYSLGLIIEEEKECQM